MSCPHSTSYACMPDTCSQCQFIVAKRVTVVKGVVCVDGDPVGSLREQNNEETERNMPAKRRTCGRCGLPGHNAATCNRRVTIPE